MKTLNSYTQVAMTQLLNETGAFFAFSNKQFDEKKKDDVQYCSLGAGLIAPKDNAKSLVDGIEQLTKTGIEQDKAENGVRAIIRRELMNYECFYTGDISDCEDALRDYGIQEDEIRAVYREMLANGEVEL